MHIVILGNGISGITTARFLRKKTDHQITVISAETDHFFSRTALMYIYMGHMKYEHTKPYEDWFWRKNKIELVRGYVKSVNFNEKKLILDQHKKFESEYVTAQDSIQYDILILAVGSKANRFGWPGQDLEGVGSLYSIDDLKYLESRSDKMKRAVIVGGGLIGIELAEMFLSRDKDVTFLVRESSYWDNVLPVEESAMVNDHIREHHIDLHLETELEEIIDNGHGSCSGVITNKGERIPCDFVGLTAGVRPNVDFLRDTALELDRGILVDDHLQTNIKDVYAIGDCAQVRHPVPGHRSIEAVWYCGKMMGETLAYHLAGMDVSYNPGIWYNSAKFLDIEYQVYGTINPEPAENIESFFWKSKNNKQSIRINFDKNGKNVIGFNLMGIRFRHELCEHWIKNEALINDVIADLAAANFDPEFYRSQEGDIIRTYNEEFGESIIVKRKRGIRAFLSALKQN